MRSHLIVLALLLAVTTGCSSATGGTETGNTTAVSIRVVGYQSSNLTNLKFSELNVGALSVDAAKVVLDRLRFQPFSICQEGESDEGAQSIQFEGPFVVDLLNPNALSGLENVSLESGRYCKVLLVLKKLEGTLPPGVDPSDPIVNRSVLVEGRRSDGIPFQLVTEVDEEFELSNETTGFPVQASTGLQVYFIAFDLDCWFDGIDLMDPSVEISTADDGTSIIFINDTKNQHIQEGIEENIKHSADLFEDSDDNESLDSEDEPLASGVAVP